MTNKKMKPGVAEIWRVEDLDGVVEERGRIVAEVAGLFSAVDAFEAVLCLFPELRLPRGHFVPPLQEVLSSML